MPKATLSVLPNPYLCETDHEGRLCGHVQYEPSKDGSDVGVVYVGAMLLTELLDKGDEDDDRKPGVAATVIGRPRTDDHVWTYDIQPVTVPCTAYYLRLLQHRSLFAADRHTQRLAFGSDAGFIDPYKRIAQLAVERKVWPAPESKWREACAEFLKPAQAAAEAPANTESPAAAEAGPVTPEPAALALSAEERAQ